MVTKYFVYKTTNLLNGKIYIGAHSCNCEFGGASQSWFFMDGTVAFNPV